MQAGSLFSGIGGIEIGFEREGIETAWFIENEPYAQAILKKRFPHAQIYGDITQLDFEAVPKVDILTGGFPCQDISNAGKRAGIEGSRSSLWKYYKKAIRVLRPKFALIENVSALASRGLDVVLSDLASIGYDAEWYCIPASAIGAPHQRDRIFIIAYPNSDSQPNESVHEGKRQRFMDENVENSQCDRTEEGNRKENDRGKKTEQYSDKPCIPSPGEWDSLWAAEPELGRVADGIPNRVDRIRCLGNAVVPQLAQIFAKAIKEAE